MSVNLPLVRVRRGKGQIEDGKKSWKPGSKLKDLRGKGKPKLLPTKNFQKFRGPSSAMIGATDLSRCPRGLPQKKQSTEGVFVGGGKKSKVLPVKYPYFGLGQMPRGKKGGGVIILAQWRRLKKESRKKVWRRRGEGANKFNLQLPPSQGTFLERASKKSAYPEGGGIWKGVG